MIGLPEISLILIVLLCVGIILVIPYWRIFGKAGFPPAMSLLMVIPLVNLGMLYFLAFSQWPGMKPEPPR